MPLTISTRSSTGRCAVSTSRTDVREICLAHLDKTRPVLVLTRELARPVMTKVTVAPITSTIRGLSSEVPLGRANGLDLDCAASIDNVLTIPVASLGRTIGILTEAQERDLARAIVLAYDLEVPLMS
ncbi:MAG: type II toxin-antitoxin system PemK/MazF family toxin [Microbacterium sp.]